MMKINSHKFLFLCFCLRLFLSFPSHAQTKDDLRKQKEHLEKEITFTGKLIEETRQNRKESLEHLITLNKKIALRQRYISAINREISLLEKQITENASIVEFLENDLRKIKDDYARMILFAYKNRNANNRLMFLFSSSDFQQAYKRSRFLKQYAQYRRKQAGLIMETQKLLNEKIAALEIKKNEKRQLLLTEESEKKSLAQEKSEQNEIYEKLKTKESSLKDDLKKKQAKAAKLQKAIEDIIAEEMRKAREAAKSKGTFELTPEAMELSSSFSKNKGKLPWPVERGIVTGHFGMQDHPVLKGIKINNNGIDITTEKESQTLAVFSGTVTGVIVLPGGQKAVIVQHGEFFTVYGNLKDVFVKKSDKITLKQPIGIVNTDEETLRAEAHLELWRMNKDGTGTLKLNPEEWIIKR
ncbi:MAG: peptidoglycan DD-metalloendopeptidase family protein [Bacteroidetes bacterium]|nr:peptidoglycan DD-metalloendopeptidase family protein [Bacteroidota bacterium]